MTKYKELPKTVGEAVDRLIEELDRDALIKIRDSKNLSEFHLGLGMYIRNKYVIRVKIKRNYFR